MLTAGFTYSGKHIINHFKYMLLWSLQRHMDVHPKCGLDFETDDVSHTQEGIKKFITDIIEVSWENRVGLSSRFEMSLNHD